MLPVFIYIVPAKIETPRREGSPMNWNTDQVILEKRDWRLGLLLTPKRGRVKIAYVIGIGALGPIPKLRPFFHRPKKRPLFVPPFGLN